MSRYIDADELLRKLPDDLPYKASVKRVLMQSPTANVAPIADTLQKMQDKFAMHFGTYTDKDVVKVLDVIRLVNQIAEEILEGI